jgi:hypothetical protein
MESKAEVNKKEIPLRTNSNSCEGTAGLVMTGMNLRREETAHQSAASAIATTKPPMMVRYSLSQQRQRQEEAEEALGVFGRWRLQGSNVRPLFGQMEHNIPRVLFLPGYNKPDPIRISREARLK